MKLALPLLICLCLAATGCGSNRGPLPPSVARPLRTPDGTEVAVACPNSPFQGADPEQVLTAIAGLNINTPSSVYAAETRAATLMPPEPTNPLSMLMSSESADGSVWCCEESSNSSFGSPDIGGGPFGFGASEEELDQMGRLCGGFAFSQQNKLIVRADLYLAVPGAEEAFRREAQGMTSDDFQR